MASADGDVEQLLASRTTTPITQLNPDLSDQATRKLHGEVTITWPYSSVNKRFAFLLAEPDFRLRREKGQVRIVLNGPSAEAIRDWELGSGDEVTLALDGVEWAKDEEPARPPGSRLDWQLKFAGKLTLKVTLGETQETKFIHLDQLIPNEPVQAPEPNHLNEIDTTIFDDEPLIEEAPPSPPMAEYATPVFIKRSRPSYGPLFEFDIDDEIEDDGGRRGKGRKRPRYSVKNGRWRYREESDSPEPEVVQKSSSPAPEQNGDAVMEDTPSKPQMTDGACQTDENALLLPPESTENTPSKSWNRTQPSYAFDHRALGPSDAGTTDTGVQASPVKEKATLPEQQLFRQQQPAAETAPEPSNPFASTPGCSEMFQLDSSVRAGFGVSQNSPPTQVPTDQQMQASSLFGTGPAPSQPMFGQPSSIGAGFGVTGGSMVDSVRFGFGQQPQSTFGGMQFTPSQLAPQYYDAHYYPASYPDPQQLSHHDSPASQHSHGREAQTQHEREPEMTSTSINVPSNQVANHDLPLWPIAAQTLDQSHAVSHIDAPEDLLSDDSIPERTPPGMIPPAVEDGTRKPDEMRQEGILSQPVFEQGVPRDALPHGREGSADEDGDSMMSDEEADYDEDEKGDDYDMRNYDRVSDDDEGFDNVGDTLSDGEMLDEDGDDFSEDEEDYDEEDYEEDDYAAPSQYQDAPQMAPRPPAAPVVIDLLSDSDEEDEAPQAPAPPPSNVERPQMDGVAKSEPEEDRGGDQANGGGPQAALPWQQFMEAGRKKHSEEEPEEEPEEEVDEEADEEADEEIEEEAEHGVEEQVDDARTSSYDERFSDGEGSSDYDDDELVDEEIEVEEEEPKSDEVRRDMEMIERSITVDSIASIPEVEEATTSSPPRQHDEAQSHVNEGSEDGLQVEDVTVDVADETRQRTDQDENMIEGGGSPDHVTESFQTQPIEPAASSQMESGDVSASFETQLQQSNEGNDIADRGSPEMDAACQSEPLDLAVSLQMESGDLSASFQTQTAYLNLTDLPEPSQVHEPSREGLDEDVIMDDAPQEEVIDEDNASDSDEDADEEDVEDSTMQLPQEQVKPLGQGSEGDDLEQMAIEPQSEENALEDKTFNGFSDDPHDAQPSLPISQLQADHTAPGVLDISVATVSSHIETQSSDRQMETVETQETEVMLSQPLEAGEGQMSVTDEQGHETVKAASVPGEELGSDAESIKDGRLASDDEAQVDEEKDLAFSEPEPEPLGEENMAASSPPQREAEPEIEQSVEEIQEGADHDPSELSDEDFHDASELPEADGQPSAAHNDDRASFVTADSRASQSRETEEIGSPSTSKPRRKGRKQKDDSNLQFVASTRGQRALSGQPPSPRTTRSKTMTFQKAPSPHNNHEDMSIQLARAALQSPSKSKTPAASANTGQSDLVERLGTDMPDCVPLKDLKSYNRNTLDFAAVATSHHTPPQRTKARQYVTGFTVTDPSIAPDGGVIEVSLFRAHKDFLPIVKPGDSVLLRGFTVTALSDKGFGLQTHPEDSSWAVFDTDGEDAAPQIRGPPVELGEEEKGYLVDLRGWYAALDEGVRDKLARVAGEMAEKGRESRGAK
ncbi:hypothetical protein VMCG_04501 [Cytospora schulzeri]|uniref:Telomeric single stranded DNA binding POT1/Cdc13 domain-containing protein n=1 Tax=Cytospora schulzeri TaxID=448051 RepID=A0A423WRX9_9PEZI|nr:hypothetical protein VMCG_04501 [Valsa malicola]